MKALQKIFIFSISFCLTILLTNCNRGGVQQETVTEPFNVEFTGNYTFVGPDTLENTKCTDSLSVWRAIVDGSGMGTHLDKFTAHFDFCGDAESNYYNVDAYLVAEKGDTLFITCEGQVLGGKLDDHADYVTSYWRDSFTILGGTGRFANAIGEGTTDDYNSSEDSNSHHRWSGTITLLKEKR